MVPQTRLGNAWNRMGTAHRGGPGGKMPKLFSAYNTMASLNYHNAFRKGSSKIQIPGSLGAYVPLPCICKPNFQTSTTMDKYLVIQWTDSAVCGMLIGGAATSSVLFYLFPALGSGSDLPTSLRPIALSASIRNTTRADSVEGSVTVLNSPSPIKWDLNAAGTALDAACLTSLQNLMQVSPDVRSYAGHSFTESKVLVSLPASATTMKEYVFFSNATTDALKAESIVDSSKRQPFNSIILRFAQTSTVQNYDVAIAAITGCRFPSNHVISQLAVAPAPVDQHRFDQGVHAANQGASSLLPSADSIG
jgi:hypothetical protein